jgi:putative flippase GtrA
MIQRLIRGRVIITRFVIVGATGFFVNYTILEGILAWGVHSKVIAELLAMLVTINLTFYLHDKWTYSSRREGYYLSLRSRYLSYLVTNSSGSLLTVILFGLLVLAFTNIVALGAAAVIVMCWNFIMNLIVWRHSSHISPVETLVDV